MIIDGQWGSTGKGLLCGYLVDKYKPDTLVCNFGPNAGHTVITDDGRKVVTCQLPTGIIGDSVKNVMIGPGAIIDPEKLTQELAEYWDLMENKNLFIHERAAIVLPEHRKKEEELLTCISSTCKGTGAAVVDKILRTGGVARDDYNLCDSTVDHATWQLLLNEATKIQIESAQGFELGINTGSHYPHCTSRDITPAQVLSDCAIPISYLDLVIAVCRTYPIRVGNAYDKNGKMIGYSGDVYNDQVELSWEGFKKFGVEPETTTVTGKIRRIFSWSSSGFLKMLRTIEPDWIFLNFMNYLEGPQMKDLIATMHRDIKTVGSENGQVTILKWFGYGPKPKDIISFIP